VLNSMLAHSKPRICMTMIQVCRLQRNLGAHDMQGRGCDSDLALQAVGNDAKVCAHLFQGPYLM
jgi:hypothetical protein